MFKHVLIAAMLGAACSISACSFDPNANANYCGAGCPDGKQCYRGLCIGVPADGGVGANLAGGTLDERSVPFARTQASAPSGGTAAVQGSAGSNAGSAAATGNAGAN